MATRWSLLNAYRAAEFLKYDHPNLSKFDECTFQSNRGKRGVTIWDCENIHFEACNFLDLGNLDGDGSQSIDVGITLLDGGMIVENGCIFEDLTIGIDCVNTIPLIFPEDLIIGSSVGLRNIFRDNSRHIQASGMNNILIQENNFGKRTLGGLAGIPNAMTGGVRVFDKSNFIIQKNSFSPTNLFVSRNDSRIGKIRYNSFTSNEAFGSIFVFGDNRKTNFNYNCFFNETVSDVQYFNSTDVNSTLNPDHGDDQTPYFNAFSQNHLNDRDIFILDYHPEMTYRYHPAAEDQNTALIPRCGLTDNTNVCSSTRNFTAYEAFNPGPDSDYEDLAPCLQVIPEPPIPNCLTLNCLNDLRTQIRENKEKIDNGDTNYLLDLINSSPNSPLIKDVLDEATPFLSDEVMKALILTEDISETIKEDVLLNNAPLSAKITELVTVHLNSDINTQIALANESESFSPRRLLEIDIYSLEYDYALGFEEKIKQLSKINNYSGLEEILIADETIDSQRRILGLQLLKKDFQAAQLILDNLPLETIDDNLFKQIQTINLAFLSSGEIFELSTEQEDFLYQAVAENQQSSSYARGLLMLLKGENFLVTEDLSTNEDVQQTVSPNIDLNANDLNIEELSVFPNPAKDEVTIQIPNIVNSFSNSALKVINANGNLVKIIKLSEGEIKTKINIADYPNGLYFIGLWNNETLTSFKRLVISK